MFLSVDGRARGIARAYRPCCEVVSPSLAVETGGARTETPGLRGERIVPVPGAGDGRLLSASADDEVPVSVGRRFWGLCPCRETCCGCTNWPIAPYLAPMSHVMQNPGCLAMLGFRACRGGYEIRTREAVTPTRFPSVRHRPLGESSIACGNAPARVTGQLE